MTRTMKNRLLIVTSDQGGGHVSATKAVVSALENEWEIHLVSPCEHIPMSGLYNTLMRSGHYRSLGLLVKLQPIMDVLAPFSQVKTILKGTIDSVKPDLIISVIPVANKLTMELAQEREIPLIVIPTDLAFDHFFHGIQDPYSKMKVAVPFDGMLDSLKLQLKRKFPRDSIVVTGYPLRPEFTDSEDRITSNYNNIATDLGIGPTDKVVVLMMGAQGSGSTTMKYVNMIVEDSSMLYTGHRIHVLVMCGENLELKKKVTRLHTATFLKIHAVGKKDANYIAALLHHANVFISKPGGSSVNEALCSEVYTLYDSTSAEAIHWENYNMRFAIKLKSGEAITRKFTRQLRTSLLKRDRPLLETCPGRNFQLNLRNLVQKQWML